MKIQTGGQFNEMASSANVVTDECDESSVNRNMMGGSEDGSLVTPLKKKKRVLKQVLKKRKKSILNTSRDKLLRNISWSAGKNNSLNASVVQRQTLRTNNRALAQSLARVKLDLRMASEMIVDLRRNNQELMINVSTLKRVAGIKDEEIESEVQRRLEKHMLDLKEVLANLSDHLYASGVCLGDALEKCLNVGRSSLSGSRSSSLGKRSTSLETCSPQGSERRSVYHRDLQPCIDDDGAENLAATIDMRVEMSMIAEQSILLEEDAQIGLHENHASGILERVEENEVQATELVKERRKDLPRRIPLPRNLCEMENESKLDIESGMDSESVMDIDVEEKEKSHIACNDRRHTFVLSSKDVPVDVKNPITIAGNDHPQSSSSCEELAIGLDTVTIPVRKTQSDTNINLRRETFFVAANTNSCNQMALEKPENICTHDRRGTFVLPKPPVFQDESSRETSESQSNTNDDGFEDIDDKTTYFNTDMDFTEIINIAKPTVFTKNLDPKKLTEKKDQKNKDFLVASHSDSSENDVSDKGKSVVELKLPKPGKIMFSACRKEIDGTRKPVSSKLPVKAKSRSKKAAPKVKALKSDEVNSVFDFHDLTPTVAQIQSSVYDISMNESAHQLPLTMQEHRASEDTQTQMTGSKNRVDHKKSIKSGSEDGASIYVCSGMKEKAMETLGRGETLYSLPMKGSPEDEKQTKSCRTRSKSRTRSQSKQRKHLSDDEDFQPLQRGRSRSQSGKKVTNSDQSCRRTRSRSRQRKSSTDDVDHDYEGKERSSKASHETVDGIEGGNVLSGRQTVTVDYSENSDIDNKADESWTEKKHSPSEKQVENINPSSDVKICDSSSKDDEDVVAIAPSKRIGRKKYIESYDEDDDDDNDDDYPVHARKSSSRGRSSSRKQTSGDKTSKQGSKKHIDNDYCPAHASVPSKRGDKTGKQRNTKHIIESSDDDDADVHASVSSSQGRSRSKKQISSDKTGKQGNVKRIIESSDDDDADVHASVSSSQGRSRSKKQISSDKTGKQGNVKHIIESSDDDDDDVHASGLLRRGRSRSRKWTSDDNSGKQGNKNNLVDSDDEDEAVHSTRLKSPNKEIQNSAKVIALPTSSRSGKEILIAVESKDDDVIPPSVHVKSRSKKRVVDDIDDDKAFKTEPFSRSRSRSRKLSTGKQGNVKHIIESSDDADVHTSVSLRRGRSGSRKRTSSDKTGKQGNKNNVVDGDDDEAIDSTKVKSPNKEIKNSAKVIASPTSSGSGEEISLAIESKDDDVQVIPPSIHVESRSNKQVVDDIDTVKTEPFRRSRSGSRKRTSGNNPGKQGNKRTVNNVVNSDDEDETVNSTRKKIQNEIQNSAKGIALPTSSGSGEKIMIAVESKDDDVIPPSVHVKSRSKKLVIDDIDDDKAVKTEPFRRNRSRSRKRVEDNSKKAESVKSSTVKFSGMNDDESESIFRRERGRSRSRKRGSSKEAKSLKTSNVEDNPKKNSKKCETGDQLGTEINMEDSERLSMRTSNAKNIVVFNNDGDVSDDEAQVKRKTHRSKATHIISSASSENAAKKISSSRTTDIKKSLSHDNTQEKTECKVLGSSEDTESRNIRNTHKTPSHQIFSENKSEKKTGSTAKTKSSKKKILREQNAENDMKQNEDSIKQSRTVHENSTNVSKDSVRNTPSARPSDENSKVPAPSKMLEALKRKLSYYKIENEKILQENSSDRNSVDRLSMEEPQAKRSKRTPNVISYKEPALGGKLRRGDVLFRKFLEKTAAAQSAVGGKKSGPFIENAPHTDQ